MTTFREAVKKLQIIYNECSLEAKNKKKEETSFDEFTRLRKNTHADVKRTREMLKEREELLSSKPGSKEAAEASHRIRSKLKQLREDAAKMSSLQKQEEKKKNPDAVVHAKEREEVVQLVYKHIEELESLEKKRFNDKVNTDRSVLFQGATSVKIEMTNFDGKPGGGPGGSDLPDIDPDPEVAAGLQQLDGGNREIDQDLDQIHVQVGALKEIAINMDREIDKQNAMLETIEKKVENAQTHLDTVNNKMKKAVDGVMKGDKFMVNFVLISVILCLVGFIASYFL